MGVSGSGKSTVGKLLASALGLSFVDGDDLHPAANRKKMAAGIALDDADRMPWLDAIAAVLAGGPVVVACSALRRIYRDRLRAAAPGLRLVYLWGTAELLRERLSGRRHAFMPAALLDSQLATLEEPDADERALWIDIALPPEEIVARAVAGLSSRAQ
jgi:carbohydrate kinase (thermoresistant glucokinase family)